MPNKKTKWKQQCQRVRAEIDALLKMIEQEVKHENRNNGVSGPLTERHHWILEQLRCDVKLTRSMVEREFGIGSKQAKRTLADLTNQHMARFVRNPRPGHYVLIRKGIRGRRSQAAARSSPVAVDTAPVVHDDHAPVVENDAAPVVIPFPGAIIEGT